MKENELAVMLLDRKAQSYDRAVRMCLECLVDKKPTGKNLILVEEQRLLYAKFRDELIEIRNALM